MHELDQVRAQLQESNERIVHMDEDFTAAHRSLEAENLRLLDELEKLNAKYSRLVSLWAARKDVHYSLIGNISF